MTLTVNMNMNRAGAKKNSAAKAERLIAQWAYEVKCCESSLEMGVDAAIVQPRLTAATAKLAAARAELLDMSEVA